MEVTGEQEGWIGRRCDRSKAEWLAQHQLEHAFYESRAFKARYVLAASLLQVTKCVRREESHESEGLPAHC